MSGSKPEDKKDNAAENQKDEAANMKKDEEKLPREKFNKRAREEDEDEDEDGDEEGDVEVDEYDEEISDLENELAALRKRVMESKDELVAAEQKYYCALTRKMLITARIQTIQSELDAMNDIFK